MKSGFKLITLFLLAAVSFTACKLDDDGDDINNIGNFWMGYADVQLIENSENFNLILDDGSVMEVRLMIFDFPEGYVLRDGMRVIANFSKIDESVVDGEIHWLVRLNGLKEVLSKKPVYSQDLSEEEVGEDSLEIRKMWLSGKYLNTSFRLYYRDAEIKHFINLWVNEDHPKADENNVYVELRHNAYGDAEINDAYGRASFDISELIPEGKSSVTVHVSYTDYSGRTVGPVSKAYSLNINEEPGDLQVKLEPDANIY